MIDVGMLARIPLLEGLNEAAMRELAARAVLRRFDPGTVLWRAGAEAIGLFVVLEGEVRVMRTVNGRRHLVHVEGAGGTLGEVPLFSGGRYPATAVASRRSVCVVLDRAAIAAAVRQDPELAFALLGRLADRVRTLIGRLAGIAGSTVANRLATYLLSRHEAAGGQAFSLGCSQSELAEELGTVREVVVKSLREIRTGGLIGSAGRARFVVTDEAALRALSAGTQPPRTEPLPLPPT
ncbi:Crp/Fnr family transcriptional regulator [soil metagenome]